MDSQLVALEIHENYELGRALGPALAELPVESYSVESCNKATDVIAQHQPLLVFVDLSIWRLSRTEILEMQIAADQFFNVIVVGSAPDIETYVKTVEQGAFEYTAPPFFKETLNRLVQSAAMDARYRRESVAELPEPYAAR